MLNYIELQNQTRVPVGMSEAKDQILRLGSPVIHRYFFGNNNKRLDHLLLGAMADALEEAGVAATERLKQLRRDEHSVKLGEIDLLGYYYHSAAQQPQELEALNWPSGFRLPNNVRYFRAYWPESRFVFVGEAGSAVNLCLTCRLPKGEGKIVIALNGEPQVELTINSEWSTWDIKLAGETVVDDLNEIAVRWPMPEFQSTEALTKVTARLCELKFPYFFPIFGEIHSLTASNGEELAKESRVAVQAAAAAI
jgi:hypothetical protein